MTNSTKREMTSPDNDKETQMVKGLGELDLTEDLEGVDEGEDYQGETIDDEEDTTPVNSLEEVPPKLLANALSFEAEEQKAKDYENAESIVPSTNVVQMLQDEHGLDPSHFGYALNYPPSVAREVVPDEEYWRQVEENSSYARGLAAQFPNQPSQVLKDNTERVAEMTANYEKTLEPVYRERRRKAAIAKAQEAAQAKKREKNEQDAATKDSKKAKGK